MSPDRLVDDRFVLSLPALDVYSFRQLYPEAEGPEVVKGFLLKALEKNKDDVFAWDQLARLHFGVRFVGRVGEVGVGGGSGGEGKPCRGFRISYCLGVFFSCLVAVRLFVCCGLRGLRSLCGGRTSSILLCSLLRTTVGLIGLQQKLRSLRALFFFFQFCNHANFQSCTLAMMHLRVYANLRTRNRVIRPCFAFGRRRCARGCSLFRAFFRVGVCVRSLLQR